MELFNSLSFALTHWCDFFFSVVYRYFLLSKVYRVKAAKTIETCFGLSFDRTIPLLWRRFRQPLCYSDQNRLYPSLYSSFRSISRYIRVMIKKRHIFWEIQIKSHLERETVTQIFFFFKQILFLTRQLFINICSTRQAVFRIWIQIRIRQAKMNHNNNKLSHVSLKTVSSVSWL